MAPPIVSFYGSHTLINVEGNPAQEHRLLRSNRDIGHRVFKDKSSERDQGLLCEVLGKQDARRKKTRCGGCNIFDE
jgi:hypothetical protein